MIFETESLNRMHAEIRGITNDLEKALATETGISRKYSNILICGMGASAIGGSLLANSAYYSSKVPVYVAKTIALPAWADKNTLFVACSYSGNTYETLELYSQAVSVGLDVVAVTSGGKLEEESFRNGNTVVKIGGGRIQPRSAIGWFVGLLGRIIEDAGGPEITKDLSAMIPKLARYVEEFERDNSFARTVADHLSGKVPVIYGAPDLSVASLRMKTQLNENSKVIAFSGELPEFNHNEIVGWYNDSLRGEYSVVIMTDRSLEKIDTIINSTKELLDSRSIHLDTLAVKGDSILEKNLYAVLFGDYVSLYLAASRNINPCDVAPIIDIKDRIGRALDRAENPQNPSD